MKLLLLFSLLLPLLAHAQIDPLPLAPALAAKSYILYDYTSNQILVNQNGNERIEPASLTELMTAYLTFAGLKLRQLTPDDLIMPSAEALRIDREESRMFLDKARPVAAAELLRGLIVQSGNDAARVLAITLAGSEEKFSVQMNHEAQRLNMDNTHFVNATGIPHPQHYSTAYDLTLLAAALIRDFPEYYPIYHLREYKYNNITQVNSNRLLWMDPYVDGLKTGYTDSSKFSLIASVKRDQRRLISVLIGAPSDNLRIIESQKLLNFGLQNFVAIRLYQKNQVVADIRLGKGAESRVNVGFREDLFLAIPKGQQSQLKASMEMYQPIIAPISNGQKIGVLKMTLGGKPYAEFPLVALDSVPLANIFSRGWDSIRLLFQ